MSEPTHAELVAANINPRTRLATDFLNHFNEAIMLLEMIPAMPECAAELADWRPLTYREHFEASSFRARELAIAAYESADAAIRDRLDHYTDAMTTILVATRDAMATVRHDDTRARLAEEAANWLKPLVAHAGAVINGTPDTDDAAEAPQADVDYIMTH
jgi:hypothetical protein